MPQDMQQNDSDGSEQPDMEMIKRVLQKVIDDMDTMESDRLMPDHMKPKVAAKVDIVAPEDGMSVGGIPKPNDDSAESYEQAEPENQDNQHEPLDPEILSKLMEEAGSADSEGSTPDNSIDSLDPDLAEAVRRKRMK